MKTSSAGVSPVLCRMDLPDQNGRDARARRAALVDATASVTVVHQNHDYAHHQQGRNGVYQGAEARRNLELAGGQDHYFTLRDATHELKPDGLKRCVDSWHVGRHLTALPILRPWTRPLVWAVTRLAEVSSPLRTRLGLALPEFVVPPSGGTGVRRGSPDPTAGTPKALGASLQDPGQTGDLRSQVVRGQETLAQHALERSAIRVDSRLFAVKSGPLITIGITCYNEGDWLLECWQSVLAQTDDRWSAVLVMDGTEHERTREIFQQLSHPKLRKCALPANLGPYPARNKAFELTDTPYHFYLDADDQLPPDSVKIVLATFARQPEVGIVFGDYEYFGLEHHVKRQPAQYTFTTLPQGGCAYRKDVWQQLGGFAAEMQPPMETARQAATTEKGLNHGDTEARSSNRPLCILRKAVAGILRRAKCPQQLPFSVSVSPCLRGKVLSSSAEASQMKIDPVLARGPADYDFHLSAIEAGVKGQHCGGVFYRRRVGHPSVTGSYRKDLHEVVEIIARRHPKLFTEHYTREQFLAQGYKRAAIANDLAGARLPCSRLALMALCRGGWRDTELWALTLKGLLPRRLYEFLKFVLGTRSCTGTSRKPQQA